MCCTFINHRYCMCCSMFDCVVYSLSYCPFGHTEALYCRPLQPTTTHFICYNFFVGCWSSFRARGFGRGEKLNYEMCDTWALSEATSRLACYSDQARHAFKFGRKCYLIEFKAKLFVFHTSFMRKLFLSHNAFVSLFLLFSFSSGWKYR